VGNGAPAAAVLFAAEVNKRTSADPRMAGLQTRIAEATANGDDASRPRAELTSARPARDARHPRRTRRAAHHTSATKLSRRLPALI